MKLINTTINDIMIIIQFEHQVIIMWYYLSPDREKVIDFPFYLISIGLHELQENVVKENGHPNDQFFFHTKGIGILNIYDKTYQLEPGMGFFIPKNVPHSYHALGDEWNVRWLVPGGSALPQLYNQLGLHRGAVYNLSATEPLDIIMDKMKSELVHDKEFGNYYASGHVYEYIIEFARQARIISSGAVEVEGIGYKPYLKYMKEIKEYISLHYYQKITMEHLCKLIKVSPQHLCRIIKQNTGMRPMEYINNIRIDKAKIQLKDTNKSLKDVAISCGYENYNYFFKTFKSIVKMTPQSYKSK